MEKKTIFFFISARYSSLGSRRRLSNEISAAAAAVVDETVALAADTLTTVAGRIPAVPGGDAAAVPVLSRSAQKEEARRSSCRERTAHVAAVGTAPFPSERAAGGGAHLHSSESTADAAVVAMLGLDVVGHHQTPTPARRSSEVVVQGLCCTQSHAAAGGRWGSW